LYKIIKYEGAAALWKGLSPALLMSVPANVIYFVGYDYLRDLIKPYTLTDSNSDCSPLVAGAVARTIAVTMISPIELFRTRLQATTGVHDFKRKPLTLESLLICTDVYSRCPGWCEKDGCARWIQSIVEGFTANFMERCAIFCYLLDGI